MLHWADETPFSEAPALRPTFVQFLLAKRGRFGETTLSRSTFRKSCQLARRFFQWAKVEYPFEFKKVNMSWIETLRPPRLPEQQHDHVFVALDEVLQLTQLPVDSNDFTLLRDQAAAALLFCSGARAGAFGSLPIQSVDLNTLQIKQWPSLGVRTKNGKSQVTYLLNIPPLIDAAKRWDALVRERLPETAMWFTPITIRWGEQILSTAAAGAHRNSAVSGRLQLLYQRAQLDYHSAHKFRHGHAVYALQHARSMADYKAISQNLMHADVRITDGIYAPLLGDEVRTRMTQLTSQAATTLPEASDLAEFLRKLSRGNQIQALHLLADEIARA
jgi:integrase